MTKSEENWYANYEELKARVLETGHFFPKHSRGNNWCRYQRKRMKAGLMPEDQKQLFVALENMRSTYQKVVISRLSIREGGARRWIKV